MKNQNRQFIILLVLLAAAVAAFFGLKQYNKTHTASADTSESESRYEIGTLDSSKVDKITVTNSKGTMHFYKKNKIWKTSDDSSEELDQSVMSGIAEELASNYATVKIDKPSDLSQYGLDKDNAVSIEIAAGKDTLKLTLGAYNGMISKFYIMKDGDPSVYAVSGTQLSSLGGDLDSFKAAAETSSAEASTTD
jgi:hypothetical protein